MGGAVSSGSDNNELVDNLMNGNYIRTKKVEQVFRALDRAAYMTPESYDHAYKDLAWRSGPLHLSSPCIYSEVMEGLELSEGLSFLNIGSGTGYLSSLVGLILGSQGINHGVEVHPEVYEYALTKLAMLLENSPVVDDFDFCQPTFFNGNGLCLVSLKSGYDRVYCGAACPTEYEAYFRNLIKVGGILVMPLNDTLVQVRRVTKNKWVSRSLLSVTFAPLRVPTKEEAAKFLKLDEQRPPRLEVLSRGAVRAALRAGVMSRYPELRERTRRAPPRARPSCPRRICIPVEPPAAVEGLNVLHDLDADNGADEMNALLSLVISMGHNRVAGALRFDRLESGSSDSDDEPPPQHPARSSGSGSGSEEEYVVDYDDETRRDPRPPRRNTRSRALRSLRDSFGHGSRAQRRDTNKRNRDSKTQKRNSRDCKKRESSSRCQRHGLRSASQREDEEDGSPERSPSRSRCSRRRCARETRGTRETRGMRETRGAREPRELCETHETRETRGTRKTREAREMCDADDMRETRGTRKTREAREMCDADDMRETRGTRKTREAREARETREMCKLCEADEMRETRGSRKTPETREMCEMCEADEFGETLETRKTPEARETRETRGTHQTRETERSTPSTSGSTDSRPDAAQKLSKRKSKDCENNSKHGKELSMSSSEDSPPMPCKMETRSSARRSMEWENKTDHVEGSDEDTESCRKKAKRQKLDSGVGEGSPDSSSPPSEESDSDDYTDIEDEEEDEADSKCPKATAGRRGTGEADARCARVSELMRRGVLQLPLPPALNRFVNLDRNNPE